jgi:cytidylate kinase
VIVTLSRAYGAAGHSVARLVAVRLGYRLVDDDLPRVVATRLGMQPEDVGAEEREDGIGSRFLRTLASGVPELAEAPGTDDVVAEERREIERAVHEAAAAGDAVIVGRGSSGILAGRADLVRAFVGGALAWRAERIATAHGVSLKAAREEIARVDAARRAYARNHYRIAWGEIESYDVLIDTARLGVTGGAATIVAAVRAAEANAR